jgi:hypothetical protein
LSFEVADQLARVGVVQAKRGILRCDGDAILAHQGRTKNSSFELEKRSALAILEYPDLVAHRSIQRPGSLFQDWSVSVFFCQGRPDLQIIQMEGRRFCWCGFHFPGDGLAIRTPGGTSRLRRKRGKPVLDYPFLVNGTILRVPGTRRSSPRDRQLAIGRDGAGKCVHPRGLSGYFVGRELE